MKKIIFIFLFVTVLFSCMRTTNTADARNEVYDAEKSFEKMVSEKGIAEAFYFYADDDAVIRRGNDSLVKGKENIKSFYLKNANPAAELRWTPDYVEVSECGTLAYTYGRYVYTIRDSSGNKTEQTGVFHTVWKKGKNGWRYVWD